MMVALFLVACVAFALWGLAGIVTNHVTGSRVWGVMPPQTKAERRQIVEGWVDAEMERRALYWIHRHPRPESTDLEDAV